MLVDDNTSSDMLAAEAFGIEEWHPALDRD